MAIWVHAYVMRRDAWIQLIGIFAWMFIQAKVIGKASAAGGFSEYDEYVPMIDKTVDDGWKKQVSFKEPRTSKGYQV